MIAQVGDYVPMRGDGEHICRKALKHIRYCMRGETRLEAERHSSQFFEPDDRVLTVRTKASPMGSRTGSRSYVVASLTAMNVWDLVELDRLQAELSALGVSS